MFNKAFVPDQTTFVGTMLSFATFAVGFLVRPIGGFVFGHVGDRIGRTKTLALTMLSMGGATALMAVLPTTAQTGVLAPILLLLLRIVQGFALGGEWAGAVLIAVEHGPPRRRGLFDSIPQVRTPADRAARRCVSRLRVADRVPVQHRAGGFRL